MEKTEQEALWLLKKLNFKTIQQLDWIAKNKNGEWVIFEIKERELFNPPPFLGTGLDKRQIYLRDQLFKDLKLRTVLFVFEKNTKNVYYQYLDLLEAGTYFDTKNEIRIYPIEKFRKNER